MSLINSIAIAPTATNKQGRTVKFTPERIEQIKNLVERGTSREQIAEFVGCTVGSLQVTCSRLGISLRRRRPENGVQPVRRVGPVLVPEPVLASPPAATPAPAQAGDLHSVELVVTSRHGQRRLPVLLPTELVTAMAMTCAVGDIRITDFIVQALTDALKS